MSKEPDIEWCVNKIAWLSSALVKLKRERAEFPNTIALNTLLDVYRDMRTWAVFSHRDRRIYEKIANAVNYIKSTME